MPGPLRNEQTIYKRHHKMPSALLWYKISQNKTKPAYFGSKVHRK